MKKVLYLFVFLFVFSACSKTEYTKGTFDEATSTYRNDFFVFEMTLTDEWTPMPENDLADMIINNEETKEEPMFGITSTGDQRELATLISEKTKLSEDEFLEKEKQLITDVYTEETGVKFEISEVEEKTFGSHTFKAITTTANVEDTISKSTLYVKKHDGYMFKIFTIGVPIKDSELKIEPFLSSSIK